MTITRALGSTFIIILLLTAALVYNAGSSLRQVADNSALVASDWMPRLLNSRELEAQFLELRVGYLTHMTSLTDASMTQAETLIEAQRKEFEASLQGVQKSIQIVADDSRLLEKIEATYAQYVAQSEELISISRSNNKEDAVKVLDQMTELAVPLLADIRILISHNLDGAHTSIDQGLATYNSAMHRNFVVGGSVGLIIILSTLYVVFGMARPIRGLRTTIIALAEGKNDVVIPYRKRRGEVGEIANAVEVFRQAAIENERLQAKAQEQRNHADAEREHVHAEAERQAQEKLDDASCRLADGLRKLAMGHLDVELSEPFAPEFEGLRHDLNASAQQLSRTLIAVSKATGNIDAGLRQIDAGAVNLAGRTEIQASSLRNTVASINQITQTVEAATKRLMTARSLVSTATERAHNSETVVTAAVNAMRGIEKSSSRISMIIGVIDEISFQTNLLALNAGVEAARAGDAGNGFAVVASEVRELARRSATAAREIKELIASSKSDVATGVALVEQTGIALAEIQEAVGMIDNHMDAVTGSAAEQANELSAISGSIRDLDALTRNNVDLVAATNRETTFLANESEMLQQILRSFKLPSNAAIQRAA